MTGPAEGWDGQSIRKHVENAMSVAQSAQEVADEADDNWKTWQDERATLEAEVLELAQRISVLERLFLRWQSSVLAPAPTSGNSSKGLPK